MKAPLLDEVLGLAIIKIIDGSTCSTILIKLNSHATQQTIIFKPEEMLGVVDLRSLGYYKIKQGILQQNLSKYYRFKGADMACEYFNKFINTLKKESD